MRYISEPRRRGARDRFIEKQRAKLRRVQNSLDSFSNRPVPTRSLKKVNRRPARFREGAWSRSTREQFEEEWPFFANFNAVIGPREYASSGKVGQRLPKTASPSPVWAPRLFKIAASVTFVCGVTIHSARIVMGIEPLLLYPYFHASKSDVFVSLLGR